MAGKAEAAFDQVRMQLASPETMRGWSWGEVTRDATFHGSLDHPVPGGLFCTTIFGPLVEWRCRCGAAYGEARREKLCKGCATPVLRRRARRERMGHIDLAAPVAHVWFFKGRPSPLAQLL